MRVRFAPSPDRRAAHRRRAHGALQLAAGARHAGGTLVLRIEDTDRERSTPENVEQILDALRWLELDWRRGPDLAGLSAATATRRCCAASSPAAWPTAPPPRATTSRPSRRGTAPTAASAARTRGRGPSACACPTRARPSSTTSSAATRRFQHGHLDDPVIARADGSVLYNFAVAIDDARRGHHARRSAARTTCPTRPSSCSSWRRSARRAAALRAPPAAARPGRQEALQAPRRGLGPGAARRRLPARGGPQLPRAARLGRRRRRDRADDAASSSSASPSTA